MCERVLGAAYVCLAMLLAISFVYGGFRLCLSIADALGLEGGWHALAMLVMVVAGGAWVLGAMGPALIDLLAASYLKSHGALCKARDRVLAGLPL